MAQAANLEDVSLPLLMPGVKLNTSPKDYRPIKDGYMVEFRDGQFNVISELLRGFLTWRPVLPARIYGVSASLGDATRAFIASLMDSIRLCPFGGMGDSNHFE